LLSDSGALSGATEAELLRALPDGATVWLLGGTAALAEAVADRVTAVGLTPMRIGGANRFETAVAIAREGLSDPATLLLADGGGFADAVAAGAAGAHVGGAVLLTSGSTMAPATDDYLDSRPGTTTYAVGGPAAAADPSATPLSGATRFETAITVADEFFAAPRVIGVATGRAFPDALAGGAHVGGRGGPLLLSEQAVLPATVAAYLDEHAASIATAYLYGGEAALSAAVEQSVEDAIS
jgi:hypothetical protein